MTVDREELKPCPFCKGKAERREYDDFRPYEPFGLVVDHAPGCFLTFTGSEPDEEFDAAWNTRAVPETPSPDVMEVWRQVFLAWDAVDFSEEADLAAANVIAEARARWEREAFEKAAQVADGYEGSASVERADDPSGAAACEIAGLIRALKEPRP